MPIKWQLLVVRVVMMMVIVKDDNNIDNKWSQKFDRRPHCMGRGHTWDEIL